MGRNYVRKNPPANYISLVDGGFWARFSANRDGKQITLKHKLFNFSDYNFCPVTTKAAAEKWVKYWAPRLKKPLSSAERPKLHKTLPRGKEQKVCGVHYLIYRAVRKSGAIYERHYWNVNWSETAIDEHGQKYRVGKKKGFMFDKNDPLDKQKKFEKALKFRKKMESKHYKGSRNTR